MSERNEATRFIKWNDHAYDANEMGRASSVYQVDSSGSDRLRLPLLHQFDAVVEDADIPQYLDEHKSSLRFPETLLLLLVQAEREAIKKGFTPERGSMTWTLDGRAIILRNKDDLVNKLLPLAFSKAKFSSFTRKLYRWGFRQVKGESWTKLFCKAGEMAFWHPLFQRENKPLVLNMKSTTSQGTRRALVAQNSIGHQDVATPPVAQFPAGLSDNLDQATASSSAALSAFVMRLGHQNISTPNHILLGNRERDQIPCPNTLNLPLVSRSDLIGTTDLVTFDEMTKALVKAAATLQQSLVASQTSSLLRMPSITVDSALAINPEQASRQLLQSLMKPEASLVPWTIDRVLDFYTRF